MSKGTVPILLAYLVPIHQVYLVAHGFLERLVNPGTIREVAIEPTYTGVGVIIL